MDLPIMNFFTFPEEIAEAFFSPDSSMLAVLLHKKNIVVIESVEYLLGDAAENVRAK